jgi:hypothetical protein
VGKAPLVVFPLCAVAAWFLFHRQEHFNVFGQLLLTTEFWMFSLPFAAVFAVCLELMMRERAGITRSADHKVGLDR